MVSSRKGGNGHLSANRPEKSGYRNHPGIFCHSLGARALLLDVDNTLSTYTSHTPMPGAVEWVRAMEAAGFQMIIISNNYKKRVEALRGHVRPGLP